jgi:hypothetical protein
MSAVLGVSLLCLAALGLRAAVSVYRRPAPPRWATVSLISELITVGILAVGVFGVAFVVQFVARDGIGGIGRLEGVLVLAALAVTVFLWRLPRARGAAAGVPPASPPRERVA